MKTAGRIFGFGLISFGLIGIFGPNWPLITGIILAGLFLAREMLAIGFTKVRAWWLRRSATTPTTGSTPDKKPLPKWIKYPAWVVILAALILFAYRESWFGKFIQFTADLAEKTTVYSIHFKTLGDIPIPIDDNLQGKFIVRIPDREFSFNCANGAYGNGHTTETACKNCGSIISKRNGNILLRVKKGNQAVRSGEPIVLYRGEPVTAVFTFSNEWEREIVDKILCDITAEGGMTLKVALTPVQ